MKIPIEQLMYTNYIKYSSMQQLTQESFNGSDASTVNIFIDLYSIFKPLYRSSSTLLIENYTVLTSSIINLCAHIKDYYLTRHRVECIFYIIYSTNCPNSAKHFYPDYNYKMTHTVKSNDIMTNLIKSNINLLNILCPYLHNIFLIEDKVETGVIIYDLASKLNIENRYPNIIFTKDIYLYQLPSLLPDTVIFRNFKKDKEDLSWSVTINNVLNRYIKDSRGNNSIYDVSNIHPSLLSLLITLTNLPERNIKSILNLTNGIKIISEAIINKRIINGYNSDIEYVVSSLNCTKWGDAISFVNRFKAVDIIFQHSIYMNSGANKNTSTIVNLFDPETVKQLNNEYFRANPLDLNRL